MKPKCSQILSRVPSDAAERRLVAPCYRADDLLSTGRTLLRPQITGRFLPGVLLEGPGTRLHVGGGGTRAALEGAATSLTHRTGVRSVGVVSVSESNCGAIGIRPARVCRFLSEGTCKSVAVSLTQVAQHHTGKSIDSCGACTYNGRSVVQPCREGWQPRARPADASPIRKAHK